MESTDKMALAVIRLWDSGLLPEGEAAGMLAKLDGSVPATAARPLPEPKYRKYAERMGISDRELGGVTDILRIHGPLKADAVNFHLGHSPGAAGAKDRQRTVHVLEHLAKDGKIRRDREPGEKRYVYSLVPA